MTKNRKIKALALLSLAAFAAVMGAFLLTAQAADATATTNENALETATTVTAGS